MIKNASPCLGCGLRLLQAALKLQALMPMLNLMAVRLGALKDLGTSLIHGFQVEDEALHHVKSQQHDRHGTWALPYRFE